MTALLTTAYWPSLHYFYYVLHAEHVLIEQHENYQKQSYRNRTQLLSANGPLSLTIPIHKKAVKELTKDIAISYQENWQIRHWRAILSAYSNSPYFEYFEGEIHRFYTGRFESLLEYNLGQLQVLLKLLQLKKSPLLTTAFEKEPGQVTDLRSLSDAKTDFTKDVLVTETLSRPYYQTFGNKFGFEPNLSVLDLLFNKGLETLDYLEGPER